MADFGPALGQSTDGRTPQSPDPALLDSPGWQTAVDAAADIIYGPGGGGECIVAEALTAALSALIAAGYQVLPPGGTVEYGVTLADGATVGGFADLDDARRFAAALDRPHRPARVSQRTTGPWQPVPEPYDCCGATPYHADDCPTGRDPHKITA